MVTGISALKDDLKNHIDQEIQRAVRRAIRKCLVKEGTVSRLSMSSQSTQESVSSQTSQTMSSSIELPSSDLMGSKKVRKTFSKPSLFLTCKLR